MRTSHRSISAAACPDSPASTVTMARQSARIGRFQQHLSERRHGRWRTGEMLIHQSDRQQEPRIVPDRGPVGGTLGADGLRMGRRGAKGRQQFGIGLAGDQLMQPLAIPK